MRKTPRRCSKFVGAAVGTGCRVMLVCGAGLLSGCLKREPGAQPVRWGVEISRPARDSLFGELRRVPFGGYAPPENADLRILNDTSDVVPGLEYLWGDYAPPETADVLYRGVVAERRGTVVVLRTPSDWARAAADWSPSSAGEAVGACQEIVHVTTERDFPRVRPHVYYGNGSLSKVRNGEAVQHKAVPPVVKRVSERA